MKYSLNENVVSSRTKDAVQVVFLEEDNNKYYRLNGLVGEVVLLGPENLSCQEILSQVTTQVSADVTQKLDEKKLSEILEALTSINILVKNA